MFFIENEEGMRPCIKSVGYWTRKYFVEYVVDIVHDNVRIVIEVDDGRVAV